MTDEEFQGRLGWWPDRQQGEFACNLDAIIRREHEILSIMDKLRSEFSRDV